MPKIMWSGPLMADDKGDKAITKVKTTLLPSPYRRGGMYTLDRLTLAKTNIDRHLVNVLFCHNRLVDLST